MENPALLNKLEKEQSNLYIERNKIDQKINDVNRKIKIIKNKMYMACNHKWVLDSDYASPYNDKEYYCSICGLHKDYDLETLRYTMMLKKK